MKMELWSRVYRRLLILYPRDVRQRDGDEMVRLFTDMVDQARRSRGPWAAARVAARIFSEAPWSAFREHRLSRRRSSRGGGAAPVRSSLVDTVGLDIRFALRTFRNNPGFTAVAVMTLALGIGATTSMFSVVNASLIRPPPFPDPDRLVMLYLARSAAGEPARQTRWSYPEFELLRELASVLDGVAAYTVPDFNLAGDEPEHMEGEVVSANYFDVLGIGAALGRTFAAEEDVTPGSHPVAMLGSALWQRRFGGDSAVVGRTIRVNRIAMTVIGVAPPGFRGLSGRADLWITQAMGPSVTYHGQLTDHQHFHNVVARLRPDVSLRDATVAISLVGTNIAADVTHEGDARWGATVRTLHEARIDPTARWSRLLLFGAVGLVLLIACANLVNLLLARAASRTREITIRLSVGSTRARLVRQLLTESLLLSAAGGFLGIALAFSVTDTLSRLVPQTSDSSLADFAALGVDRTVLAFAIAISVGIGLLLGLAPALRATRTGLIDALRQRTETSPPGARSGRLSSTAGVLVVSEFALASILSVGATLLLTTYGQLQTRDVGFEADQVLTFWVQPPLSQYRGDAASPFMERILAQVSRVPGVESATVSLCTPLMGCSSRFLYIVGREWPEGAEAPLVGRHYVAPDHFTTLRIPLLRGRALSAEDRRGRPRVTAVSETAARRYWPNQDPIGQRVWLDVDDSHDLDLAYEIVGVVGDVQYDAIDGVYEPEFYTSYLQFTWPYAYVMVRSAASPDVLVAELRRAVALVDGELAIHDVQTLEQRVDTALAKPRFNALMMGGFAALALTLAAMGIYGVMAHFVAQRRSEVGVRIALGASNVHVLRLVLLHGGKMVVTGMTLGAVGALIVTRLLSSIVYEVSVSDPRIFVAVNVVLAAVALAACYLPTRRALRVDPMRVLRAE